MSEVIYVDFRKQQPIEPVLAPGVDNFIFDFVERLNNSCLVDDDIEDIVEAVENYEKYLDLDEELKALVDAYFHELNKF